MPSLREEKFRPNRRCLQGICDLVPLPSARLRVAHLLQTAEESPPVPRRVKDFIDISEYTSLDDLIRYLEAIRDNLPKECEAELKIRGDDVFGRRLTITYFREQTPEEAELEAKYSNANEHEDPTIEQL